MHVQENNVKVNLFRYRSQEIKIFEEHLEEKAKAKAEDVVTQWFSQPRTKLDWDKIAVINDKVYPPTLLFLRYQRSRQKLNKCSLNNTVLE